MIPLEHESIARHGMAIEFEVAKTLDQSFEGEPALQTGDRVPRTKMSTGMAGIGSNDVAVKDIFVPAYSRGLLLQILPAV